ncbi:hypothetical protein ACFE04_003196 [Oxalis oulophora]
MEIQRGSVVWARVTYPHKYLPGTILTVNSLGVLVSFFDFLKPNYFLESEICSFQSNFATLIDTLDPSNAIETSLLNRALRLVGRRAAKALNCHCVDFKLESGEGDGYLNLEGEEDYDCFSADVALGFIKDKAVLAFVEEGELMDAAVCVAQVTAFRMFSSIRRKLLYKKERSSIRCNANALDMELVASVDCDVESQQSAVPIMIEECQTISEEFEKQLGDSSVFVLNESIYEVQVDNIIETDSNQSQEQSLYKALNFFASMPFHLMAEYLQTVKQKFRSFGVSPPQNLSDQDFEKYALPETGEAPVYNPSECEEGMSDAIVHYNQSQINQKCLKRKLDPFIASCPKLKLFKTMPVSTFDLCLKRMIVEYEAAGLSPALVIKLALSDDSYGLLKTMALILSDRGDSKQPRDLMDLLQHNFSLATSRSHRTDIVESSMAEVHNKFMDTFYHYLTNTSHFKTQGPEKCITNDDTKKKLRRTPFKSVNFDSKRLKQYSKPKTEFNHAMRRNSIDGDSRQMVKSRTEGIMNFNLTAREKEKQNSPGDMIFVKSNRLEGDSLNLQETLQKKTEDHGSLSGCKTLHMKFPRDYKLPSTEEMVKKFSSFGRIDCLKTKVYFLTGSARVVFWESLDCVTAYQYAKTKKAVFGQTSVRFWLDPYESKRISKFSAAHPSSTLGLKPCLKSDSNKKQAEVGHQKVRFLMVT